MLRSLALLGAFSLPLALAGAALSQPAPDSARVNPAPSVAAPKVEPMVSVDTLVPAGGGVLFGVSATNIDVRDVLRTLAGRTTLNIIFKTGTSAKIARLSLAPASPDKVLEEVCRAAELSCQKRDGVWLIGPQAARDAVLPQPVGLDLAFRDIDANSVLQMIATGFGLKIQLDPAIKREIPFVSLDGRSPRAAVDLVAEAADLEVREADGVLVITPQPKT